MKVMKTKKIMKNKEIKQINIIKDLINQPNTYKLYQIEYQKTI